MLENLLKDMSLIVPEIIVSATLLLIVLFDLIYSIKIKQSFHILVLSDYLLHYIIQSAISAIQSHAFIIGNTGNEFGLLSLSMHLGLILELLFLLRQF